VISTINSLENWLKFASEHPHEFTIQYPPRPEYFQENFKAEIIPNLHENFPKLLLYVHIPFCEARCYYCNFAINTTRNQKLITQYIEALCQEIDICKDTLIKNSNIPGIDIGGGTPTHISSELLGKVIQKLSLLKKKSSHPFPLSIETIPLIAANSPQKLEVLKANGVDRISMGIQSFNEKVLQQVNRNQQYDLTIKAAENIHNSGFKRFNCDLIFGLPHQSLSLWEKDLERVISLNPDSITTYDCLYRGKGRLFPKIDINPPTMKQYGDLYNRAYERLIEWGYHTTYGSVNFSKRKNETGTSAYFEGRLLDGLPYLGFGNYASSWLGDYWYFNQYEVEEYIEKLIQKPTKKNVISDFYYLPVHEQYSKYILYSLNFGCIDRNRFNDKFKIQLDEVFQEEMKFLIKKNWLEECNSGWKIVEGEFSKINLIRSVFYSAQAKNWLKKAIK
jgi:oxygen-independent coproporphyrinogen III oxidase